MTVPCRVWLDTDPGFDDYMAWALLEADPRVHVAGVSVVAGNAPLARTLSNALRIQALHGWSAPVHAGCARALAGTTMTAQDVLGDDAMRSAGRRLPRAEAPVAPGHGADALIAHVRAHSGQVTLLALGPLSNVATAFERAPELPRLLKRLVLMGGSTDRGNASAVAEFNIAADPEAAARVFGAGIEIEMVGLNACRQVEVGAEHVDRLRCLATQNALLFADLLQGYVDIARSRGARRMPLYDPTAVAWLALPGAFDFEPARVEIELDGRHTRGMTVCEFRVPARGSANAKVAVRVDGGAVVEWALSTLCAWLRPPTPG